MYTTSTFKMSITWGRNPSNHPGGLSSLTSSLFGWLPQRNSLFEYVVIINGHGKCTITPVWIQHQVNLLCYHYAYPMGCQTFHMWTLNGCIKLLNILVSRSVKCHLTCVPIKLCLYVVDFTRLTFVKLIIAVEPAPEKYTACIKGWIIRLRWRIRFHLSRLKIIKLPTSKITKRGQNQTHPGNNEKWASASIVWSIHERMKINMCITRT